jgi:POTRA domain, FtsQ-type/Cell division protein FtsQ
MKSAPPPGVVKPPPERPERTAWRRDPEPSSGREAPPRPRMDPRLAQRWVEVRRQQGRRRLRIVLLLATPVVLAALAAAALYSPLLRVHHVRVSVAGTLPAAQVRSVSQMVRPGPMLDVNPSSIAAELDAVPNLGGARVARSWPTTVRVRVVARTPVAVVARPPGPPGQPGATGWETVDATGRVLADVAAPTGLPQLQGASSMPVGGWLAGSAGPGVSPPGPAGRTLADLNAAADSAAVPQGTAAALAIAAALSAPWRADVSAISVVPGARLTLSVVPANAASSSITVVLGDASQLAAKLTALVTLLGQANLTGVTQIDLTVPNRPATLTARQSPGTLSTQSGG